MKCDELKVHKAYNRWLDEEMPTPNDDLICNEVYLKSEVDAAIAELKAKLEDAKATAYAESVDAGMENRRLKRALWLARADRAIMTLDYFTLKCRWFKDYMKVEPPGCDVKMVHKWANIERKCRAKAEEYK